MKNVNSCSAPIASITYNYNDSKSYPSLLRTPTIPRKSSPKRKIGVDKLVLFQATNKIIDIDSISEQNSPENFIFKRYFQIFNLKCNEETAILVVHECITVDRNLHVRLSYHGLVIPLPQCLRYEHNHARN